MKIYLASPFFNSEELEYYTFAIQALRSAGYEVYVPQEHEVENAWSLSNHVWARKVFIEDIRAIEEAEVVMVLNWGMYSDSGTAWEAGYAYALKKQVIQVLCGKENEIKQIAEFIHLGLTAKTDEQIKEIKEKVIKLCKKFKTTF